MDADFIFGKKPERIATIRDDFTMPTPPKPGMVPCVIDDGDGWSFEWNDEELSDGCFMDPQPWPFIEDKATEADLEAAGFEVL